MYKAFISYSHASDAAFAPSLQSALEKFAKPWFRMRSFRVFRDTTNLSVTPQLWPAIEKALAESEYLLLLASTKSSGSRWIAKELNFWRTNKDISKLFIIQTSGEIRWDESAVDFDWDKTTSIPLELKGAFVQEPLFPDFRELAGLPCSLDNNAFLERVATIAAPLHGLSKDEIFGEHIRQHRKTMRLAWLAVTILLFLAGTSILMWHQASTARKGEKMARDDAETAYRNEKVAHAEVEAELKLSKIQSALALFGARKVNEMHAILDAMPANDRTWLHHFLSTSPPSRPKTIFKTQWRSDSLRHLSWEHPPKQLLVAHRYHSSLAEGAWLSVWRSSPPTFLLGIYTGDGGELPICKIDSNRLFIYAEHFGGEKYGTKVNGTYLYRDSGLLRVPIENAIAIGTGHRPPTADLKNGEPDWEDPEDSAYSIFSELPYHIDEDPLLGDWVGGKFICARQLPNDDAGENATRVIIKMGETWYESECYASDSAAESTGAEIVRKELKGEYSEYKAVSMDGTKALVKLQHQPEDLDYGTEKLAVIETKEQTTIGEMLALTPHRGMLDFEVSNDGTYVVVHGTAKIEGEGWYIEKLHLETRTYETLNNGAFEGIEDQPQTKWLLSDDGELVVGVDDHTITLMKGDEQWQFVIPNLTLDTIDERRCLVSLENGLAIIGTIVLDLQKGRIVGHLPLGIAISPDWKSAVLADVNGRIVRWELGLTTPPISKRSSGVNSLATFTSTKASEVALQTVDEELLNSPRSTLPMDLEGERFPETRQFMLPNKRVTELTPDDLQYAINEMIARRGGTFQRSVQQHFEQFDWYTPRPNVAALQIESQEFSVVEKYNFKLLGARRDELRRLMRSERAP